eukprot:27938-Amphidinium_carterae.2
MTTMLASHSLKCPGPYRHLTRGLAAAQSRLGPSQNPQTIAIHDNQLRTGRIHLCRGAGVHSNQRQCAAASCKPAFGGPFFNAPAN